MVWFVHFLKLYGGFKFNWTHSCFVFKCYVEAKYL
jgi:hypothetical protein